MIDPTNNVTIFDALGAQLEILTSELIQIVVCGGAALQALGLIERSTRDVDVLAVAYTGAAARVARDFELPSTCLNAGPTGLMTEGLPDGLAGRMRRQAFGKILTMYFIGRYGQICFKLHAAVNGGGDRHLADLDVLQPTEAELVKASEWILTQDVGPQFPDLVRYVLRQIGYGNVADHL